MKTARILFFAALLTVTAAANFGVGIFEPEFRRDVALRQLESSDAARQKMRAYESSRRMALYALDASVPIAFLALFGADIFAGKSNAQKKENCKINE
ncbi:MAG: hypothetical protein AAFU85_00855 [Planctomycetota bacterium]